MVRNENRRSRLQVLPPLDLEMHPGCKAHDPLETSPGGPLRDTTVAAEPEDYGGDDAVSGTDEEGEVGGEAAGVEAGLGNLEREDEEGGCGAYVEGDEVEKVCDDGLHRGMTVGRRLE